METLTMLNGNHQQYTVELPKLVVLGANWSDIVTDHVFENTGLLFKKSQWGNMEAQPHDSQQIVKLFLTYNFKTQYQDNATNHNTLYLKGDHHQGFHVDSICYDCCKENHINVNGLKQGDRLAC